MRYWNTLIIACIAFIVAAPTGAAVERSGDLRVQRWQKAKVQPHKKAQVRRIVARIMANKDRYVNVDKQTNVPWYVIACLHNMESSGSFHKHLHEGSSLRARTRWVPKGRPKTGKPPFKWEYSAKDALSYDKMGDVRWAYLFDTIWAMQRYNGTGYWRYHRSTPTQYLYAGTTIERPGKYVSDGKWSSTARSKQLGIATIIKTMEEMDILCFDRLK